MAKLLVEASRVARQHSSVYSVFPNTHKCFPILLTYFIYTNSSQSTTVFYTLCTQGQLPWLYCGCGYTSRCLCLHRLPLLCSCINYYALSVQRSISSLLTSEPKPHPTATFATLTGTQRMIMMAASIFYIQSMLSPYKILTVIWFSC